MVLAKIGKKRKLINRQFSSCLWIVCMAVVMGGYAVNGWAGSNAADRSASDTSHPESQSRITRSELPVDSYDDAERERMIAAALQELLIGRAKEMGWQLDTASHQYLAASNEPAPYIERYGYLTRAADVKSMSRLSAQQVDSPSHAIKNHRFAKHLDQFSARQPHDQSSAAVTANSSILANHLADNEADSNLYLYIKWNLKAIDRLLAELFTEQGAQQGDGNSSPVFKDVRQDGAISAKVQTTALTEAVMDAATKVAANKSSELEHKSKDGVSIAVADHANKQASDQAVPPRAHAPNDRPLVLLWLSSCNEVGKYHLLDEYRQDVDIALVEFLRKGARHAGMELLFPTITTSKRDEMDKSDWANSRNNRQVILQLSERYAADLIVAGSVRKRILTNVWQGDWHCWDGQRWLEHRTVSRNHHEAILALWRWLSSFDVVAHSDKSWVIKKMETHEPLQVKLHISQVDSLTRSKEVMAYLRNLSSMIHRLELINLRADSIDLHFAFAGSENQLRDLLQGEYGVVLANTQQGDDAQDRTQDYDYKNRGDHDVYVDSGSYYKGTLNQHYQQKNTHQQKNPHGHHTHETQRSNVITLDCRWIET